MQRKLLKEVIRKELRIILKEFSQTIPNILQTAPRPRYRSWNASTLAEWERKAQKRYGKTWGGVDLDRLVPDDKEFKTKAM